MWNKPIRFSDEFLKRLVSRGVWNLYGFDIEKSKEAVSRMMKNDSVVIDSPDERYPGQKWCLIELPKLGLTKIPISEKRNFIVAITIANPVTDSRCKSAFLLGKTEKNKTTERSP